MRYVRMLAVTVKDDEVILAPYRAQDWVPWNLAYKLSTVVGRAGHFAPRPKSEMPTWPEGEVRKMKSRMNGDSIALPQGNHTQLYEVTQGCLSIVDYELTQPLSQNVIVKDNAGGNATSSETTNISVHQGILIRTADSEDW